MTDAKAFDHDTKALAATPIRGNSGYSAPFVEGLMKQISRILGGLSFASSVLLLCVACGVTQNVITYPNQPSHEQYLLTERAVAANAAGAFEEEARLLESLGDLQAQYSTDISRISQTDRGEFDVSAGAESNYWAAGFAFEKAGLPAEKIRVYEVCAKRLVSFGTGMICDRFLLDLVVASSTKAEAERFTEAYYQREKIRGDLGLGYRAKVQRLRSAANMRKQQDASDEEDRAEIRAADRTAIASALMSLAVQTERLTSQRRPQSNASTPVTTVRSTSSSGQVDIPNSGTSIKGPTIGNPTTQVGGSSLVVDSNSCLRSTRNERGSQCGKRSSHLVSMTNSCNKRITAQLCLEDANGKANCGANTSMDPGETLLSSVCDGTGQYRYWGCTPIQGVFGNCGGNNKHGATF